LLAAIPHADQLMGLPRKPFIGELAYGDIVRVLKRQRRWFTHPEQKIVDHLFEYLNFKIGRIAPCNSRIIRTATTQPTGENR
jgi:hypothetical protein